MNAATGHKKKAWSVATSTVLASVHLIWQQILCWLVFIWSDTMDEYVCHALAFHDMFTHHREIFLPFVFMLCMGFTYNDILVHMYFVPSKWIFLLFVPASLGTLQMTAEPLKESWNRTPVAICNQVPVASLSHHSAAGRVPKKEVEEEELVVMQDPEQQEFVEQELTTYGTLHSDQLLMLQPTNAPLVRLLYPPECMNECMLPVHHLLGTWGVHYCHLWSTDEEKGTK